MDQGADLLGPRQPLELVGAGIGQGRRGRQLVGHQLGGRPRQQDLAALRQRPQPRRPVQRLPVVVPTPELCLAGVHGRPGRKHDAARPALGTQRTLQRQGGRYRVTGAGKDRQGRVAFPPGLDEPATMGGHGLGDEFLVARQRGAHRHPVRIPQPGRPLDVGQQKRDDTLGRFTPLSGRRPLRPGRWTTPANHPDNPFRGVRAQALSLAHKGHFACGNAAPPAWSPGLPDAGSAGAARLSPRTTGRADQHPTR